MNDERENIIVKKSYIFALAIVQLYKVLVEKKEYVLSKQLVRSGTSIGANVHEAVSGESKKDFVHKLGVATKEARETLYWLSHLKDSGFISLVYFTNLTDSCNQLIKILNSIVITTKERYLTNS